jgi:amino acid adenylation domain-containing protein
MIEAQAIQSPGATAVLSETEQITYEALNARANRLARHLKALGVGPEVLVGLYVERSVDMIVGLLAVLKAGGAYVPLNPDYPRGRLRFFLEDAGVRILITHRGLEAPLPHPGVIVVDLYKERGAIDGQSAESLPRRTTSESAAYVIYTSGSTGKPKGVVVPHSALSNFTASAIEAYGIGPGERVLQFASISFDASAEEIYPCLAAGGTLVLRTELMLESISTFLRACADLGVTTVSLPTAYWHEIACGVSRGEAALPGCLRLVIIGGERALPAHVSAWQKHVGPRPRLLNTYGPTEATVVATMADLSTARDEEERAQGEVSIGRPIRGVEAYVLDSDLQPVGAGEIGELYVGGAGLSRGYLGHRGLTAERFIPNPWSREGGARLYRTGDRVRLSIDGSAEFIGRADDQVKLRGVRIELGEVESALCEHARVRQAVASIREDAPGDRRLVAHIVAQEGDALLPAPDVEDLEDSMVRTRSERAPRAGRLPASVEREGSEDLRAFLGQKLPDAMVPSSFVFLAALPLLPSGKVDRAALPAPESEERKEGFVAARTVVEKVLAAIWARVLGTKQIGVHDNFFELGGHSLLATQVMARLRDTYQIELPIRCLFESPTIAKLAEVVEAARRREQGAWMPPIQRAPRDQRLPASFAQQRLWLLDRMTPDSAFYNVPQAVRRISGPLDAAALERTIGEIMSRHEVLRTTLACVDGEPVQVIHPPGAFSLPIIDLRDLEREAREEQVRELIARDIRAPFDLAEGPLLRAALLKLDAEEHVLLLTLHHILCDDWALGVLFGELSSIYSALSRGLPSPLPALPIQYADYAVWQRSWLSGPAQSAQLAYWRQQLEGLPTLELPTDHPRPAMPTHRGGSQAIRIQKDLVDSLTRLCRQEGVTLFMALLAAYSTLFARYTEAEDIPIGVAIANRQRPELESLIGFFVNSLVMRADLKGKPSFRELLRRVRGVTLEAYANQDLPFEKLVDELQPERDLSRHPLVQVGLTHFNDPLSALEMPGLTLTPVDVHNGTAKLDLLLLLTETPEGINGCLEYNADLYEPETAARMVDHFCVLLESVALDPDKSVWALPMLTAAEKDRVLRAWNETEAPYPDDVCVHELFEAQAARTPDAVAVMFEDESLTYRELDRRANQAAHLLISLGVGPGSLVGIWMERSPEMIVAVLAILKAGGAYVPLDPAYPQDRLELMIEDAQMPVMLAQRRLALGAPQSRARVICLDDGEGDVARQPDTAPAGRARPSDLAYVIYTSGSTGTPKGVQIEHRGVCNLAQAQSRLFEVGAESRVLQFASLSFDASVSEIVMTLTVGAALCLAPRESILPGPGLLKLLRERAITTVTLPPSVLAVLPYEELPALRTLIVAGEACPAELVATWGRGRRFLNAYGPTECTVCATAAECAGAARRPPIGRPIANTKVYILDRHREPVPIGVPGEIYIGGVGLARGYLNQPALTEERYVRDPFASAEGARLYRTGDLARYLPDGSIEFLGRIDHQIKLRGFRIETGEIEAVLRQHPAVQSASVVAREDTPGQKRLVAYVVAAPRAEEPTEAAAWQDEQVAQWRTLYDEDHRRLSSPDDPTFNISDWNSSYTGLPIPEPEMREWRDQTVARIRALKPRRVLEIGCGTGLLLFPIAPECERYVGTDFSAEVLDYLKKQLARLPQPLPQVTLKHGAADDLGDIEDEAFDVVIINSVIQYFPSVDYLERVLERAARAVRSGGHIFVGDVRSFALLEAYHTSVQLHRAPAALSRAHLRQLVQQRITQEEELTVGPAFFEAARGRIPRLRGVELHLKRGRHANELTRFRYDVVLHVEGAEQQAPSVRWVDWTKATTPAAIRRELLETEPASLGIRGIPNARIWSDVTAATWLTRDRGPATAGEMREALAALQAESGACLDPEEMWAITSELPYAAQVRSSGAVSDGRFEVIFTRRTEGGADAQSAQPARRPRSMSSGVAAAPGTYANNPLKGKLAQKLIPRLRQLLEAKMPSYMVPATFVLLDAQPLSATGKVDLQALPPADAARASGASAHELPRTSVERLIADVWRETLRVEVVGVNDNFYDLGGNSLLTAQIQVRLREALGRNIEMVDLFKYPTVATLAEAIRSRQGDRAAARGHAKPGAEAEDPIARQRARLQARRRGHGNG